MNSKEEVEAFAKAFFGFVRDEAIRECDMNARPGVTHLIARRWRSLGVAPEALRVLIPDIVDEALHAFLRAIDQDVLHLKYVDRAGREIDLNEESQGEFGGWFGDWRTAFSKERYNDF